MRIPSWARFWSPSSWSEWWERRRRWREHKEGSDGPRPARPISPAWVPVTMLVALTALNPSAETSGTGALSGPETTTMSPATTTNEGMTTTSRAPSTTTTTTSIGTTVAPLAQSEILLPPVPGPSGDPDAAPPRDAVMVTVMSITDGDTLDVAFDDGNVAEVRLIGINSPESNECFAQEATMALAVLAPVGARIGMTDDVSDVDQFDRLLRYLWTGGMSVNEELVRRGAAISRRYPPDTSMADRLEAAQGEAEEAGLGLWAPEACGPRSDASLSIVALEFDPPGNDNENLNEEWIEIRNDGGTLADLTGWGIKDESASNRYQFPESFTLAPGETVTIRTGCGDDFGTGLYWCSVGSAVWNNSGDTAFLLDPNGNTHTAYTYEGEAAAPAPATTVAAIIPISGPTDCDPSYPDVCIPPYPPDLDCGDVTDRRFTVEPPDPHGFDGNDNDGLGCESG